MKSSTKNSLVTTLSMLTAVTLIAACGSKKAMPKADEKAAPGAAAKVEAGKLAPGSFTVTDVTCSSGVAAKEDAKQFVGSIYSFDDVENRYTLTSNDKVIQGHIKISKTTKTEKEEAKDLIAFSETVFTAEEGKESTIEDRGTLVYTLTGDDLSMKGQMEDFCSEGEVAEIKLKRTASVQTNSTATTAPTTSGTVIEEKTAQ